MPRNNGVTAIEVRHLTRTYQSGKHGERVRANDDVTFSIARGEVFGLLGANGAGKTTLVSQMLGLVRPTSGSIHVEGVDVVADPEAVKAMTGFLPQTGLSMRLVEVRRALHYTGRLRGQSEQEARRQTTELVDELGLGEVADRYVNQLSGGMMRLVNFGMALMGRTKLLILDEPTNELDPHNRRLIWDMVARRSATEGTTVVLVTHNVLEAEKAVHRVAVMHGGRITALGTPGELKGRMGDKVRMELFVKDGESLRPHEVDRLETVGSVVPGSREGTYLIHSEPELMPELVKAVTVDLGMARVDDFRLTRPTLEDVYLSLDGKERPLADEAAPEPGTPERGAPLTEPAAAPATGTVPVSGAVPAPGTGTGIVPASGGTDPATTTGAVPAVGTATATAPATGTVGSSARSAFKERARRLLVGLKYLWLEQMLEVRTTWTWSLLFGLLMPVAMVFGLSRIGGGLNDATSLLYIVSGAAIFSVATEGIATLAQRIGVIKNDGMMVYYASLPISKASFVAAMVLSRLLLIMPGLITPMVAAGLMYDVDFTISPALVLVLPLSCLALSAIGLAIGTLIDSMELIVVITNLLIFVLLLAAPVLIPPDSLPLPLRVLGYLLPPTYAADALRHTLNGDLGAAFTLDIAVLTAMTVFGLAGAARWIRWRLA
ncbi:ABC transporter ATP-binding protein/permease [Streptomyces tailanensis]|uniref:ABC transporter ATP-binding protein/permease n=1 Tax=Streptomyces tailanensis TaxID=2569858 RepID=UPI00122E1483|nr:ABC transporter ATP-binding protein/permease [Streptomyces tailanensis]